MCSALIRFPLVIVFAFGIGWLLAEPVSFREAPYSPFASLCRWDQFPVSANIEDRRAEISTAALQRKGGR